jgi:DNA-binding SARP family transcriptional activator
MTRLRVSLFGKLSIQRNDAVVDGLSGSKVQELFCYLLLNRDRPQPRETLASLLWGDAPTTQSKKYLRQALWQLQVALQCHVEPSDARTLLIDQDWVQLNSASGVWLDVDVLERACTEVQGVPSEQLDAARAARVQDAVDLYTGDLLEGWYQDWCLHERERLQGMYLGLIDKLIGYCELQGLFDAGVHYATLSLRSDRARECTHQRLMRLYYGSGDRAAALRQYDRCIVALDEELAVKPSEATVDIYHQISSGRPWATHLPIRPNGGEYGALSGVLGRLRRLEVALAGIHEQVSTEIQVVQQALTYNGAHGRKGRSSVRALATSAVDSRTPKPAVNP